MNNQQIAGNKNFTLKIIFILSIIISLIKIESIVYSNIDYHQYKDQTRTELVVQPVHYDGPGFCKLFSSSDDPAAVHYSYNENISYSRYALLYYENFLQIHYKIFKNNFISQTYFISILHKQKISHQTTDDVPLLLI